MIAAKVRAIRKSLGLTQAQFAKLIGASHRAVQNWEEGLREPRGTMMLKILEVEPKHKNERSPLHLRH